MKVEYVSRVSNADIVTFNNSEFSFNNTIVGTDSSMNISSTSFGLLNNEYLNEFLTFGIWQDSSGVRRPYNSKFVTSKYSYSWDHTTANNEWNANKYMILSCINKEPTSTSIISSGGVSSSNDFYIPYDENPILRYKKSDGSSGVLIHILNKYIVNNAVKVLGYNIKGVLVLPILNEGSYDTETGTITAGTISSISSNTFKLYPNIKLSGNYIDNSTYVRLGDVALDSYKVKLNKVGANRTISLIDNENKVTDNYIVAKGIIGVATPVLLIYVYNKVTDISITEVTSTEDILLGLDSLNRVEVCTNAYNNFIYSDYRPTLDHPFVGAGYAGNVKYKGGICKLLGLCYRL